MRINVLPEAVIAALRERIADRSRRHFRRPGESLGAFEDPQDVARLMDEGPLGDGDVFRAMLDKMAEWGHSKPTFYVTRGERGEINASTEDADSYPLAGPATEVDLAVLEATVGRPLPRDLRQMWAIADGGWGPGYSFTNGHGPGLHSVIGAKTELEDLRRRGPGYTGEMDWPASLLPLTMHDVGMTSYDLDTGHIVTFDEHWYDHDIAIEEAFAVAHLSLAEFLLEWVES